jgi:hypothetical protein
VNQTKYWRTIPRASGPLGERSGLRMERTSVPQIPRARKRISSEKRKQHVGDLPLAAVARKRPILRPYIYVSVYSIKDRFRAKSRFGLIT